MAQTIVVGCGNGTIAVLSSDCATEGKITPLSCLEVGMKPMFLAQYKQHLYSFRQTEGQSQLLQLALDSTSQLTLNRTVNISGQGPCHLSIAPELNAVLVAHYESGHVNLVGLDADGNVSQELASHCFQDGPYTNEGRQDGSHPHFIHYVPEANAIFVCDLGLNALHRLEYSCETATLRHCESLVLHPGAGPRHLAIQQRRLYILHELDNGITVVQLEGTEETASMTIVQHLATTVPRGYTSQPPFPFYTCNSHAAEIILSPDGKHAVISHRGYDHLTRVPIQSDGLLGLSSATHSPTQGRLPWHFAMESNTRFWVTAQYGATVEDEGSVACVDWPLDANACSVLASVPLFEPLCVLRWQL